MSKTAAGLIQHCKGRLGTPYVYGAKGDVLTQAILDRLARENPSVTVLSDGKQGKVFPHTTQVLVLFGGLLDKITHLTVKCLCQ